MERAWAGPAGGCAARETGLQYGRQGTCPVLFPRRARGRMKPAGGKRPLKLRGVRAEVEADAPTDSAEGNPKGPRIRGEEKHTENIWSVGIRQEILHVPAQRAAGAAIGGRRQASSEEGTGNGQDTPPDRSVVRLHPGMLRAAGDEVFLGATRTPAKSRFVQEREQLSPRTQPGVCFKLAP